MDGEPRGTIGPGDYFGEIALLTGSDRTATVTARTEMVCYGLTPWDFKPLVESNSGIAWKLLTAMAQKLRLTAVGPLVVSPAWSRSTRSRIRASARRPRGGSGSSSGS